ncbi:MAG: endonuclease/exonuclease/phosphatase family protein [Prevotella sp.]|jgi:endonuclease/exonuclease/phosphatase family metal-dependent hydrolase
MLLSFLLASLFTFVELNCENLFDTVDDSVKQDDEFLPISAHHWTPYRYWRKVNRTGQTLLSCAEGNRERHVPDMVALTEVENDSVLFDLTRRSLLRNAGYSYLITHGPDVRGINVALLYSPFAFRLISSYSLRVALPSGVRPTRDILYASGMVATGDTLHVFVVHAPSRAGGEAFTQPLRIRVAERLRTSVDSIRQLSSQARIIIAGDFNDYTRDKSIQLLTNSGLVDISNGANGQNGARGTYRYHGEWGSLDHILCDNFTATRSTGCHINDASFLLEEDKKYGGVKPRRTYLGPRYLGGFSDHLPLVAYFEF